MVIPSSLPRRSPRSDHVQALWSWSADFSIGTGCAFDGTAPAPMTTSDSVSADLVHLHHVGDEEREGYALGCQPVMHPAVKDVWAWRFRELRFWRCPLLAWGFWRSRGVSSKVYGPGGHD